MTARNCLKRFSFFFFNIESYDCTSLAIAHSTLFILIGCRFITSMNFISLHHHFIIFFFLFRSSGILPFTSHQFITSVKMRYVCLFFCLYYMLVYSSSCTLVAFTLTELSDRFFILRTRCFMS